MLHRWPYVAKMSDEELATLCRLGMKPRVASTFPCRFFDGNSRFPMFFDALNAISTFPTCIMISTIDLNYRLFSTH